MTDTNVITGVSVSTAQFYQDSGIISIARDYLQGYTGDYFFFQFDSDDYYLILSDDCAYNTTTFSANSGTVVKITRSVSTVPHTSQLPFSGSENGTVAGVDGGGAYHGSISGNTTLTTYDIISTYQSGTYSFNSTITIFNPDYYTTYGSFDGLPHLIEGVENYAYAGIILFFAVVAFALCDRLFKRLY